MGYEHAWAVWSMGGRLGGWGMASAQEDQEGTEAFMGGVKDLVSSHFFIAPKLTISFGRRGILSYSYLLGTRVNRTNSFASFPSPKAQRQANIRP